MIPADRRADAARPGFRLVQLIGPPQDAWLRRLDAAGMRVLQYYPHNTYLVWSRQEAGEAVGQLDFVRWQGLFHPAYKINSDLQGRTGRISNVDVMFYENDSKGVLEALTRLGAEILQVYPVPAGQGLLRRHRPHRRRGPGRPWPPWTTSCGWGLRARGRSWTTRCRTRSWPATTPAARRSPAI